MHLILLLLLASSFALSTLSTKVAIQSARGFAAKILLTTSSFYVLLNPPNSYTTPIAAAHAAQPSGSGLVYKSGKNPVQQDPNDPKVGSKKDTSFLRCMSNCKAKCQLPSEGLAKSDCVVDCQDQCCATYEQCSFKYKSSTGNSI